MATIARILVPLAGIDLDEMALDEAAAIAELTGAEIVLLSVAHYHTRDERSVVIQRATRVVEDGDLRLMSWGVRARTVLAHGEVADEIVREAELQAADLIVMGTCGHGSLRRLVEGSIPDRVRRRSQVPVLLVRRSRREGIRKLAA